jgi:ABC-2 type transport system ATP-binding protein
MTATVEAHALQKSYGKKTKALDGLELVAETGRVVAVLGPNGAGKTTFVRAVATLLRPDAGELHVLGHDVVRRPERVRPLIGLAGQFAAVEPAMTGRENLEMVARLYGEKRRSAKARAAEVLDQLGLVDAGDRLVRTYSGGMRRRLDLGASLVGRPRLLLLDEPTTGLDPRSRNELWDAIKLLVAEGTDVLLTTQYLDEADQLAGQIVIIDHGRAIANGTPAELKRQVGGDVLEIQPRVRGQLDSVVVALARLGLGDVRVNDAAGSLAVQVDDPSEAIASALHALGAVGIAVDGLGVRQPTLDEVFLALTGRPAEEETTNDAAHRVAA